MILGTVYGIVRDRLVSWYSGGIALIPELFAAALVVIAFWIIASAVRTLTRRAIERTSHSRALTRLSGTFAFLIVVSVGFFIALGILGLGTALASLLAGVGILGLALGFAFQSIAANFIAGIVLAFEKPFDVGDLIQTQEDQGIVELIHLRSTTLRTLDGQLVVLPNQQVLNAAIRNFDSDARRLDLVVGVSYGEDLEHVEQVTKRALITIGHNVRVYYTGFGDSSIDLVAMVWLKDTSQQRYLEQRSKAVKAIKAAYNREGITIPFPIRTLDFGIKGGKTLKEMR